MSLFKTGDLITPLAFAPITPEQLRSYAEASGDPNPIHLDEEVARKAGLPGIIAHGMLTMAFLGERALQVVQAHPEAAAFRLVSFQSRFKAMTLLGDVISVSGLVKVSSEEGFTLELHARNQGGVLTTLGSAKFQRR